MRRIRCFDDEIRGRTSTVGLMFFRVIAYCCVCMICIAIFPKFSSEEYSIIFISSNTFCHFLIAPFSFRLLLDWGDEFIGATDGLIIDCWSKVAVLFFDATKGVFWMIGQWIRHLHWRLAYPVLCEGASKFIDILLWSFSSRCWT